MDTELRKRFEGAAEKYVASVDGGLSAKVDGSSMEGVVIKLALEISGNAFNNGAEFGYKEAITEAKGWLEEHAKWYYHFNAKDLLSNFEKYMNKLWEDEK